MSSRSQQHGKKAVREGQVQLETIVKALQTSTIKWQDLMSHNRRKRQSVRRYATLSKCVYLDAYLQAVRLFSDCVLCSRMWSKAHRVNRDGSVTSPQKCPSLELKRSSADNRCVRELCATTPDTRASSRNERPLQTAPSLFPSLPPSFFPSHKRISTNACNLSSGALRNSGTTRVFRDGRRNRYIYLRESNLFRQCPMEMWAHGR